MVKLIKETPEKLGFDAKRLAAIPAFFDSYLQEKKIPNFGLLVARDGKIAHHSYSGTSAFDGGFKPNGKSIYRIFSMTKPLTSIAIMQLYEQGKLMLIDEITKYFPAYKDVQVFESGTALDYKTRAPERMITIRDLLTHQSGLTYDFMFEHPVDAIYRKNRINGAHAEKFTLKELVQEELPKMPLICSPGEKWNYSLSTDVLGHLVEVISGQTLDDYMAEHIFKPLGMNDTSFTIAEKDIKRLTHNYSRDPDTGVIKLAETPEKTRWRAPRKFLSGGGGLLSTMEDYFTFCEMLRRGGTIGNARIIGTKTLDFMLTNQLPDDKTIPECAEGAFSEVTAEGTGFGLGFSVVVDAGASPMAGSLGNYSWGGLASTFFWNDPVEDMTVIFLTQLMPSRSYPIRQQLQQLVYAALN